MIIFTLYAYRRGSKDTHNHKQRIMHEHPYNTAKSDTNHALAGPAMAFMHTPSILCDSTTSVRPSLGAPASHCPRRPVHALPRPAPPASPAARDHFVAWVAWRRVVVWSRGRAICHIYIVYILCILCIWTECIYIYIYISYD